MERTILLLADERNCVGEFLRMMIMTNLIWVILLQTTTLKDISFTYISLQLSAVNALSENV